jgi:hypothetical protein
VLALAIWRLQIESPAHTPTLTLFVTIDAKHPGPRIPHDFLGLSFEVASLAQVARYGDRGNLVELLRSLGRGLLRFGGVTADTEVGWTDARTPLPAWASQSLDEEDLRGLRTLAYRSGWHVLLTIGLAHFDPRLAAGEARAAKRALGPWLAGIELGNEPDAYARHGLRAQPWTSFQYNANVAAYRRAIDSAAPGLPVLGPDVSGSAIFRSWGPSVALHDRLALLSGHHYPLGCHSVPAPTIARLLSLPIRQAEDASLRRYLSISRRSHLRFRLDEANSVSCGGEAGISDRFDSALWAIDYIAHAMAAGASGINLQANPSKCTGYTPLCASSPQALASGALTIHPEWYALVMSRQLLGDRPVHATVSSSAANVDVLAFLSPGGELHVLAVDDELAPTKRIVLGLRLPGRYLHATALTLSAPSPSAATGVRLGGGIVEGDGRLRKSRHTSMRVNRGALLLDLAPATATLVTAMR